PDGARSGTVIRLFRRRYLLSVVGAAILATALGIGHGRPTSLLRDGAADADALSATSKPVQVPITFQKEKRSYWLYRPAWIKPVAQLLVVLPGDGFPTPGVPDYELLADREGLVLAFPLTESKWRDPQDSPFVGAVIDDLISKEG